MVSIVTGLGGPQGVGENSFIGSTLAEGNLDDGSVLVDVTSVFGAGGLNFYGTDYTSIYINTNGNVTFNAANVAYTPAGISSYTDPMIAPFFTDINLSSGSSTGTNNVYWDFDTVNDVMSITWLDVVPYSGTGTNTFQMRIHANANGSSRLEFLYEDIQFSNGYQGEATVGFTDGGTNVTSLPGSGDGAALLVYETTDFGTGNPAGMYSQSFSATGAPVCFADGTLILTPSGEVHVEELAVGDLIMTLDHGPQALRWIGKRSYQQEELAARASLLPIRIDQNALGPGMPTKPLWLSQQHRIMSENTRLQDAFSKAQKGISMRARNSPNLVYYHLLFDHHEIIWANGLMCESLLLGDEAWQNIGIEGRHQMNALKTLPKVQSSKSRPCRRLISVTEAKRLLKENHNQQAEVIA